MMNSPDIADNIKSHLQSLKMLRSLSELISLCWYFSPDKQEENNKQHYFIFLFRLFQSVSTSHSVVFANLFFEKCLFLCVFQYSKHDIMLHGLVTICQRITSSAVCPSPHQPSLETSLMMASVTWPLSLGSVTQHDAGRGHQYLTQCHGVLQYMERNTN